MSVERAPAPKAPTARALRTRQRLLDAARDVFARKGYEQATVADVAARAGRGHGTFYLHFPNKKSVFAALLEAAIDEMTDQARELWQTEDFAQSVESSVAQFLEDFRINRDMWALLDQMAAVDDEFAQLRQDWHDLLTANVRRGLEYTLAATLTREEIRARSQFLAGLLDEAARCLYVEGRPRNPADLTAQITAVWLAAMNLDQQGAPLLGAGAGGDRPAGERRG